MFTYIIWELLSGVIGGLAVLFLVVYLLRQEPVRALVKRKAVWIPIVVLAVAFLGGLVSHRTYPPHFAMPPFMMSHAPGGLPAYIPFGKIFEFFKTQNHFERVADIGADPNAVPQKPKELDEDGIVRISMTTKEVLAEIAPGIWFNYWTFDNQVPGPMLRVREGDTVEVTLTNDPSSLHSHNVDFHAVTGPGGGAVLTNVKPGETKIFRWKALAPGLFIYHCATANVSTHNSHGQYGLILVEPKEGFSPVDKEFYVVQGELYTGGQLGKKGLTAFDSQAMLDGNPNYVTFNGKVEQAPRMHAKVGDTVRMYIGNGGVGLISTFHIIGEIFDTVYPNASIGGALEHNTQAAQVLPGGASIVEFTLDVPGKYLLVDHALSRMNKGAWAILEVSGRDNPEIFMPAGQGTNSHGGM